MEEKTMVADTLEGINSELKKYADMIPQTENQELKQTLKQFRNAAEMSQEEIYKLAREKQYLIEEAFRSWIFEEPERRKKYVDYYNENFNNIRLRKYDGSFLTFPGMTNDIIMREHQKNAVARALILLSAPIDPTACPPNNKPVNLSAITFNVISPTSGIYATLSVFETTAKTGEYPASKA